ncbi:MAG: metallophosphoesterase family protein [Elusimicrobia bacterium]|nr:metallophosphoesterase family protein [Elusimicrobiota bacterium]MDE2313483.1 metallophosphoesterase family protein [Elusimicrobiota bacterium]
MLYGVFSDIHSNLEALERVIEFFKSSGAQAHLCCGDLVGYGPNPNECLEMVRSLPNLSAVCGNHDLAAAGRMDPGWFNAYARDAISWTRRELSPDSLRYLSSLRPRMDGPEWTLAHGTPRKPADEYFLSVLQYKQSLGLVKTWPLFVGHSHMPLCFRPVPGGEAEMSMLEDGQEVRVAPRSAAAAFNPGSVGQPRDHDPRACCALYDSGTGSFRVARLSYDVAAVQAKIRRAGLPEFLAQRLELGR